MKTTIWVTHLSLPTLLRILTRYRPKSIDKIAYINSTFSVNTVLALLSILNCKKRYFFKINGDPISGAKLNFAEIRDIHGRLIATNVMYQVMQLRREIAQSILCNNKTDVVNLYPHTSSKPFLRAFFEFQIGKNINCAVYFANYIKWLELRSENGGNDNVLILTWIDWGRYLEPYIKEFGIEIWAIKSELSAKLILLTKTISIYLLSLALALKQYLCGKIFNNSKRTEVGYTNNDRLDRNKSFKIFVPYTLSILPYKRNDLPWLWGSEIKQEKIITLVPFNRKISQQDYALAESLGITIFKQIRWRKWMASLKNKWSSKHAAAQFLSWSPSVNYHVILLQLLKKNLSIIVRVIIHSNIEMFWQVYHFIIIAYRIAYYKDFYLSNNIVVDIGTAPGDSEDVFLRSLVMDEIGGIVVSWERVIRFGYSHFLHNKSVHVEFVTGDYSLLQLQEKSNAKHSIKSGWINDYMFKDKDSKKNSELIKESLKRSDGCIFIGLFDELWGDHILSKNIVEDFYKQFLIKTIKKPYYRLIIKPKKDMIINEMSNEIRNLIKEAEMLGRCVVLDHLQYIYCVATTSDIVVTLPSMAVFESILSGTKTLIFNYRRNYSNLFYQNNGLGRIIFEDMNELMTAIEEFAEGFRPDLGDCSSIIQEIDPFRDGNAGRRVGNYLNWFIEGIKNGINRDDALNMANKKYGSMADEYKKKYNETQLFNKDLFSGWEVL